MDLREFCENYVYLRQKPISFADRPYLAEVYNSVQRNLILRCSRQVEKSTLLCNMIIHEAIAKPGHQHDLCLSTARASRHLQQNTPDPRH